MSCITQPQSAIRHARAQLFLDSSDGVRLNVVTSNIGLDRPTVGMADEEWRAIAKVVGLQPKQIRNIFYRLMEICIAPQKTRLARLTASSGVGTKVVQAEDVSNLVQLGTLVFDPGLPTEETAIFCYRDLVTNRIFLENALQTAHFPVVQVDSILTSLHPIGSTTFTMMDSSEFPPTGTPYPIIVDRGTPKEELLVVTANNTLTNVLTLQTATTIAHNGPKSTFLRKELLTAVDAGRVYLQLDADETRVFPASGWLRLDGNGPNVEVIFYDGNDVAANTFRVRRPLTNAHLAGESVELVNPGAIVETASIIEPSVAWTINETQPRKVHIAVPESVVSHRLVDVSFLHDAAPTTFSTTLAANANIGDTVITLVSVAGFPDPTGTILIAGTEYGQYEGIDTGAVTLTLVTPLAAAYTIGDTVALVLASYPGTDLVEGNLRTTLGVLNPEPQYPGKYLYDIFQQAPSIQKSTLADQIPEPTMVIRQQVMGRHCLEVADAYTWPVPPFTAFTVRIGRDSGFAEDATLVSTTLRQGLSTTVTAGAWNGAAGQTTIGGVSTLLFPISPTAIHAAGYRIRIGSGTANDETVLVSQNDTGTGVFTLIGMTANVHAIGEPIELLADVLTFNPQLAQPHAGPTVTPSSVGHPVEKLISELTVVSAVPFPDEGTVYLNFGKGRVNARKKITSVAPTILSFDDTSVFPDADFPYPIIVGEGRPNVERASVIANNTGTNQLTLSAALSGTFVAGDYVEFHAGEPITVAYESKDPGVLVLGTPDVLPSIYTAGETVIFSPGSSIPDASGFDFPFLLPPSVSACVERMVEFVRAAGVEVILSTIKVTDPT